MGRWAPEARVLACELRPGHALSAWLPSRSVCEAQALVKTGRFLEAHDFVLETGMLTK